MGPHASPTKSTLDGSIAEQHSDKFTEGTTETSLMDAQLCHLGQNQKLNTAGAHKEQKAVPKEGRRHCNLWGLKIDDPKGMPLLVP